MDTQEVLQQFASTIDELREGLEDNGLKYNISYKEGYSDALLEFEELVMNLQLEALNEGDSK